MRQIIDEIFQFFACENWRGERQQSKAHSDTDMNDDFVSQIKVSLRVGRLDMFSPHSLGLFLLHLAPLPFYLI